MDVTHAETALSLHQIKGLVFNHNAEVTKSSIEVDPAWIALHTLLLVNNQEHVVLVRDKPVPLAKFLEEMELAKLAHHAQEFQLMVSLA